MSGMWSVALLGGVIAAAGLALLLYLVAVPRRPALVALLDRMSERPELRLSDTAAGPGVAAGSRWSGLQGRLASLLDRSWMPVPAKDLAVVEKSRRRFLLERAGAALFGLLVVPAWSVLMWALGLGLPPVIPAIASIALGALFWMLPTNRVREAAATRRREMKHALVSYLTLVALHRAAGEGASASLELAASASGSWAFRRIDRQVSSAFRSQQTVWQGLQDLAIELEIEELSDLSSIAEIGGVMGAHIGPTLLARASSLRHELLAKEQEEAAEATNRMTFPKTLLGIVLALFVLFPPMYTLASGGAIQ